MPSAPKSQVFRLTEAVAYQQGAVVSRQITQADAGNVTLFAFDAGQELSEHTTPFDAIAHVIEGAAEIRIANDTFGLNAGEAIIMPGGKPHAVKASERFKMLLTMIRT
jgi:quercetin dioxygenase-like cupin family protein